MATGKLKSPVVKFFHCPLCGAQSTEPYVTGGEVNVCPPEACGRKFKVFITGQVSDDEGEAESED